MAKRKETKWVILALILLLVSGCIPTTMQVETLTRDVDALMVSVDNYQEKFAGEVDKVQERIVAVNEAVKRNANKDGLTQFQAGWETTKDYNPYYIPGALILTILGEAATIWGFSKSKNKTEAKRQADKAGRELALRQLAAMPEDQITAPVIKEKMYSAIALTRNRMGIT